MHDSQGNIELNQVFQPLPDKETAESLATEVSQCNLSLPSLERFLLKNPSAADVMMIIQALYDACQEPKTTRDVDFITLLKIAMKCCVSYLNQHPEMALQALEKGFLLDEALFGDEEIDFVRIITQHKKFKKQYDTLQLDSHHAQLLNLHKMATEDWKNRATPVMMMSGNSAGLRLINSDPNYINYIKKQQYAILTHCLRRTIETLEILPELAPYILFDQQVAATQPSFREYLLGKVNNLASCPDTFLRRFRGLAKIAMAILDFQERGSNLQIFFNSFIEKLEFAARIYKGQDAKSTVHSPNTMQDFYIQRISRLWLFNQYCLGGISQDNDVLSMNSVVFADRENLALLAIHISLRLNADVIKESFRKHFTDLDDDLRYYLQNKIESDRVITTDRYKHLLHVVDLLELIANNHNKNDTYKYEHRLIRCCAVMGTSGMKKYLLKRLVSDHTYTIYDSYSPEMRQQALVERLTIAKLSNNFEELENIFAQLHSNVYRFAMKDWITVLQSKHALPFYEDYVNYLRQRDPYFPEFYRCETELYPSLVALYTRSVQDFKPYANIEGVDFFEEVSATYWSVFKDLLDIKPASLILKQYKINDEPHVQQASIKQMRLFLRGYRLSQPIENLRMSEIMPNNDFYVNMSERIKNNTILISDRRDLMHVLAAGRNEYLSATLHDGQSHISHLLDLWVKWPAYDYAFKANFAWALMKLIGHIWTNSQPMSVAQVDLMKVLKLSVNNPALKNLLDCSSIPAVKEFCGLAFAQRVRLFFSSDENFKYATHSLDELKLNLQYCVDMVRQDIIAREMMLSQNNYTLKITHVLTSLSKNLANNEVLQQQIADDDETLRLLGELFLHVNVEGNNNLRKEDYAALINIRDLRNSTTGIHCFSRVLKILAEQNSATFASTLAYWFAKQSTTLAGWALGTSLAGRIDAIIQQSTHRIVTPAENTLPHELLSADAYFQRYNPDFHDFQRRYYADTHYFYSKEEYALFLENKMVEKNNDPQSILESLKQKAGADAKEVSARNIYTTQVTARVTPTAQINSEYAYKINDSNRDIFIFQLRTIIDQLTIKPEYEHYIQFDNGFRDYLLQKVDNLSGRRDFLSRFMGIINLVIAIMQFQKREINKTNFDHFVVALDKAAQEYKGQRPGNSHGYNAMQDEYIARIRNRWAIVALNRFLSQNIRQETLAADMSRLLKTDNIAELLKFYFLVSDKFFDYLETKIQSPTHLNDVLNLLYVIADYNDASGENDADVFENNLSQCCKAMGTTGMKDYLIPERKPDGTNVQSSSSEISQVKNVSFFGGNLKSPVHNGKSQEVELAATSNGFVS